LLRCGWATRDKRAVVQHIDPQQLTEEMAARIAEVAHGVKMAIEGPLMLRVVGGPQDGGQINLDRIADYCAVNLAEDSEKAKAAFVESAAEWATSDYGVTRDSLRVVVRAADYAEAVQEVMVEGGNVPVLRLIGEGLVALLAADQPKAVSIVALADLEPLGLAESEAWEIGRRNVLSMLPELPEKAELERDWIEFGGQDYCASLLIAEGWKNLAEQTNGKLFITVAADNLVVAGLVDEGDVLRKLRLAVEEDFECAERGISPNVFRWSDKGWTAAS